MTYSALYLTNFFQKIFMRILFFLFLTIILSNPILAQSNSTFSEKCKHHSLINTNQRVAYYQYSSMNNYDVQYLKLDLNVETGSYNISGVCSTIVKVVAPLDTFITELKNNMIVDSIFVNGSRHLFSVGNDHIMIPFPLPFSINTSLNIQIYYHGTSAAQMGMYAGNMQGNTLSYSATLSESYQAREWFPVKQILEDKIDSTEIWITTSAVNKVGSNGVLKGIDNMPNGKLRYRWKSTHPMNYYMPSFAVGNYQEYINYARPAAISPDSILIQHYIATGTNYLNSVKTNLDKTPVFLEKLSELYGLYPFSDEKYGHCQASIGGGMEHQTMSTMSSFSTDVIAHELGHQWFGDNVTCSTWNDIWLNEGFATYSEQLLMEKIPALFTPNTANFNMLSIHNNVMTVPNGSVYVPDASIYNENRIFSSRLSYNKGAAIVHTLRFEMQSDTLFFNTLKNYQQQFGNTVASTQNFKQLAENTCGRNFNDFFDEWYYGEGYPTYNITYFKSSPDTLLLMVNETTSAPTITPFFKGYLELTVNSPQGDTTVLVNLSNNNQVFSFVYRKTPTGIVVDPNNWIINKTGTITNGVIVPVKLISFEGKSNKDCSYELKWTTAAESSLDHYEIEKSTDGVNFTKHSNVYPTSGISGTYNCILKDLYEIRYYFRLKIVDKTGNYFYSTIINLHSNCNVNFNVTVWPNPVNEQIYLSVSLPNNQECQISIQNSNGQIVRKENVQFRSGKNKYILSNLNQLPAGSYVLSIINEGETKINKKFILKGQ